MKTTTKKQQAFEFLTSKGWVEDTTSKTTKYLAMCKTGVDYKYYLGSAGAVRRGRTVSSSISVRLAMNKPAMNVDEHLASMNLNEVNDLTSHELAADKSKQIDAAQPDTIIEAEQCPDPTTTVSPTPQATTPPASTSTTPRTSLAARLSANAIPTDDAPHLIVEARAGTGKTTTLVEGLKLLKGLPVSVTPSSQQQRVWDEICKSAGKVRTIGFVAFNRSIAGELGKRVPYGVEAMTMHSLGLRAVNRAFSKRLEVTQWRVQDIIGHILGKDIREIKKNNLVMVNAVEQLVGLCKMNLVGFTGNHSETPWNDELDALAAYYDVDLTGCTERVFQLVPLVLEQCLDPQRDGRIDYDDMIYLPIALNLPTQQFDMLLTDEAQDLNRCQQALAKRSGKRLVFVGDDRQAIYGFCGADAQSLRRLKDELTATQRGCEAVPLTVTRRCGKAIVREAQRYVPDFEAHETNGDGLIQRESYKGCDTYEQWTNSQDPDKKQSYRSHVKDGDMILCRTNAPLVNQCFKFIRAGRKAQIQGRDVGKGLTSTVNKMKATTVGELIAKLSDWQSSEIRKERAKRTPSETRINAIQDRLDCLMCFVDGLGADAQVSEVTRKIEAVFTDDKNSPGIRMSSIHRSKGLESKRVFWLCIKEAQLREDKMQQWERDQEINLRYVATTRAIEELVIVT